MTFIKFPLSDKFNLDVLLCLPASALVMGREDGKKGRWEGTSAQQLLVRGLDKGREGEMY